MLELVEKDVIAVMGGTSTNATKRAAALSQYFKIPLLISTDTGDDITVTGTQWLFRIPPQNKAYAAAAFDMVKATLTGQANIAILYEHSEYGESAAVAAGNSVLAHGLNLVSYQGYNPVQIDYATVLNNIKNAAADVVYLISTDPVQASALITAFRNPQTVARNIQFTSLGVTMVIGNGSGFTSHHFLYDNAGNLTANLDNLFITVPWQSDLPWKGSSQFEANVKAYQQANKGDTQLQAVSRIVEAYTSLKVVVNAMNELVLRTPGWEGKLSGPESLNSFREDLVKALRSPGGQSWESLMGPITFDAEGQNSLEGLLVQVIDGKLMTVYPEKYKVHDVVFTKGW
jgi:branched-chain amino acid transport system substrate-binding protein